MSYIVGAFVAAGLLTAALVFPGFRLAAGIALILLGLVVTMFAMFFGPAIIALGVIAVLAEVVVERSGTSDKARQQPPQVPPTV